MGDDHIIIREFNEQDVPSLREIWNQIIEEGTAFPQVELIRDDEEALDYFATQTCTAVAELNSKIVGLYILYPDNVGRCGHIANACFAVENAARRMNVGEALVRDCLWTAGKKGFEILHFDAVADSNDAAVKLLEKLDFERVGVVPNGFLNKNNQYEDIILYYHTV